MRDSIFETIVGAVVVAVAVAFLMFSLQSTEKGGSRDSYKLYAQFTSSVQGLAVGTDVRLMGVKVGVVTDIDMDAGDHEQRPVIKVGFTVDNDVALDDATFASLASEGFLGGSFLKLNQGSGYDRLQDGDTLFENSKGYSDLGTLLSTMIQRLDSSLSSIAENLDELAKNSRVTPAQSSQSDQ